MTLPPSFRRACQACALSLAALALAVAPASAAVPEVPAPAFLTAPNTYAPGQLLTRHLNNDRTTNIVYHNGVVYTHNVTGTGRTAWGWSNLADVTSFGPSAAYHANGASSVPLFNDQGNHAHTKVGDWVGGRFLFSLKRQSTGLNVTSAMPASAQFQNTQTGERHNLYYPWSTVFDWVQYSNENHGASLWRADRHLHTWNPLNEHGVTGNSILVGNILLVTSDESANGILSYDLSPLFATPPGPPVLLDKLSGAFGAYIAVLWENYIVLSRRDTATVEIVDWSDPSNLRLVETLVADGETGSVPYVQAQDNFIFTRARKINMETRRTEVFFDFDGANRPAGSVAGPLDGSQYMMPLGPFVVTGAYSTTGRDGVGIWAHQTGPDNKPPYVGYHMPRPGQTNFPVGAPVSLLIHETLESFTIVNGESIILRELGSTTPLDCWVSFSHDDILTLTPKTYLAPDRTYEVVIPAGLIKDAAGNGILPYSFTFSTGTTAAGGNLSPVITAFNVAPARAAAGTARTFTVSATDAENDTLQYRFLAGDGTAATAWASDTSFTHTYAADGHYEAKIQVRDLKPGGATSQVSRTLTITAAPAAPAQRPTSSGPLALDAAARRVFTVNPDADSVTAVDADTLAVVWERDLNALLGLAPSLSIDPRNLALDNQSRLWVTAYDLDAVIVLNSSDGALVEVIDLGHGAAPHGVLASPDRATLFVTTEARGATDRANGQVIRYSAATRAETGRRELGPTARALALSADGVRLLVTRFISPENHGQIWELNASTMALTRTFGLRRDRGDRGFDSGANGKGVPNFISSVAISPDGRWAWYTAHKANTQRGEFFRQGGDANQDLTPDGTVRALVGRIDLSTNTEPGVGSWGDQANGNIRLDVDNSDSPTSVVFSDRGDYAFVTLQGNNGLAVYDHLRLLAGGTRGTIWRMPAGSAPQGVVLDPVTRRLFVQNALGRDLSVHPVGAFLDTGDRTLAETRVRTVSTEKLPADVLLGKQVFYHASDRMSLENYISCATCHVDGGHDGRTYDFTQRGEGLRNTTDLRGRAGLLHGRVHWTGNFDEIQDFALDIVDHFGGSGFLPSGQTPHPPLGAPNAGRSAELDALAAYLASLDDHTLPRSPHRAADGAATEAALRGAQVFQAQGCATCHNPASNHTDSTTGTSPLRDVGTLRRPSSGSRLGATLAGLDTPTLLGVWSGAPYFHDGSAETLADVFQKAGGLVLQAETGTRSGSVLRGVDDTVINLDNSTRGVPVDFNSAGDRLTFGNIDGGSGGSGAVELRYEARRASTVRLLVNGVAHTQTVPAAVFDTEWRRVYFPSVTLAAGTTNTLVIESPTADGFLVDEITVTRPADFALAQPHRRVLALPAEQRTDLLAYLLQLDGANASGPPAPAAPTILTPPESLVRMAGETAVFTVVASGLPTPSFQWRRAGVNIPGATTDTLTLTNVSATDAAAYTVVVSNSEGSVTSAPATLTVTPAPDFVGVLAAWDFAGEGGASASAPDRTAAGLTVSSAALGSGLTAINYLGHGLTGSNQTATDLAGALAGNDYLAFTLTPAANRALSLTALKVRPVSQNRLRTFTVFTSVGGFTAGQQVATLTHNGAQNAAQLTVPIEGLPAQTGSLEVRIYVHGHDNRYESVGLGNASGDDLVIEGGLANTTPPPPSFDTWIASVTTPPPSDQRARHHDPDRDGVANLLEFALGGDPMLPDASTVLPRVALTTDSRLTLTYRRLRENVTYTVQTHSTLDATAWTTDGVDQGSAPLGEEVTASIPLTAAQPRRFLRLQVE